jgi:hypothetical protein
MDPIILLLQVHKMCTTNQPICYNKVYVEGCRKMPESNKALSSLLSKTFNKFEQRKIPYGSVHADPVFWFGIFMGVYEKKLEKDNYVNIPNGCCNNPKCPIATFYNDIAETLRG